MQQNYFINKRNTILFLVAVLAATAIIYAPSLKYGFYPNLDDGKLILENPTVQNFPTTFKAAFTEFVYGLYHPLTTLSFGIDNMLFDSNTLGYRFHNLLLHVLNTLLVFVFLKQLTQNRFVALFSAAMFGVHPMHVESVIWVSERKDVLFAFYFLLSLISYIYFKEKRKNWMHGLCFLFFTLSLLAKATAVILPVALLVIDFAKNNKIGIKQVLSKSHFFLLSIVFGIVNIMAQNSIDFIQPLNQDYNFIQLITFPVHALTYYITQFFVPVELAAKHLFPKLTNGQIAANYYLSWLWLTILGYLLYRFRKNKGFVSGMLFYFIGIVLFIKIIPTGNDIVSDRYSYLPYIGLAWAFSALISPLFKSSNAKQTAIATLLVVLLIYGGKAFGYAKTWKNEITIWTQVLKAEPELPLAHYQKGLSYFNNKQFKKAIGQFNQALNEAPNMHAALNKRGLSYYYLNNTEAAITDFSKAIKTAPNDPEGYYNRGNLYFKLEEYEKATVDLNKSQQLNPPGFTAHLALAKSYFFTERFNQSIPLFKAINNQQPKNIEVINYLANACARAKKHTEAITYFNRLIQLTPKYGGAYLNRGNVFYFMDNMEKACQDWQKALELGETHAKQMISAHCN